MNSPFLCSIALFKFNEGLVAIILIGYFCFTEAALVEVAYMIGENGHFAGFRADIYIYNWKPSVILLGLSIMPVIPLEIKELNFTALHHIIVYSFMIWIVCVCSTVECYLSACIMSILSTIHFQELCCVLFELEYSCRRSDVN